MNAHIPARGDRDPKGLFGEFLDEVVIGPAIEGRQLLVSSPSTDHARTIRPDVACKFKR